MATSTTTSFSFARISTKIGANIALVSILYVLIRTGAMLFAAGDPFQTMSEFSSSTSSEKCPLFTTGAGKDKETVDSTPGYSSGTPSPCALSPTSKITDNIEYRYIFGIDIYYSELPFVQAMFTGALISIVFLPQLYASIKLIHATSLGTSPPNSIQFAFIHQKLQLVAVIAELALSRVTVYYTGYSWYENFELAMLTIFWKIGVLLITGLFIDEQIKKVLEKRSVILFASPSGSVSSNGIAFGVFGMKLPETELAQVISEKAVVITV